MYKGASASLQRSHGVHHIAPQKGYIMDDVLPGAEAMTLPQCLDERVQLKSELSRIENELIGAKRRGKHREIAAIGHRRQSIDQRLGILADRIRVLRYHHADELWQRAVEEACPDQVTRILETHSRLALEVKD